MVCSPVCTMIYKIQVFSWFFVTVLSGPVQRGLTDDTALRVPNIIKDGRKNCGVEDFLSDNKIPPESCDIVLQIDGNWFGRIPSTLCFGVYDTLYELCKYQNLSSLEIPSYPVGSFCGKATKSFENYNFFPHRDPVFLEWAPRLRVVLSDTTNCTDVCVHGTDVNRGCSVIVAALERLPKARAAMSQSKSNKVTPSLDARGSTLSGVQRQPPLPTKGSKPVLVESKKPEVSEPVAQNPASAKTEETAPHKPPSSDKTAPLSEAVKPEQVKKPESESPPEPKLENSELEPGMMDPMPGAMEDDDGPGLEAQQPDTPAEQQSDLIPAKDAPIEPNKFPDDDAVKQENPMSFPGDQPYLPSKDDSEETNMVTYFVLMTGGALLFYIAFHNKNKLLALALEGRRTGRRGGRHSSAAYSKLHSNLEETIASGPTSPSATHVLY